MAALSTLVLYANSYERGWSVLMKLGRYLRMDDSVRENHCRRVRVKPKLAEIRWRELSFQDGFCFANY